MKPRRKRLLAIVAGLVCLGAAAGFVLAAFQKNLVFFFTPTQVVEHQAPVDRTFRIGGLVEKGSLKRDADGLGVHFTVTDTAKSIDVDYRGSLPDLFKEGKGVVAQGQLDKSGQFHADQVLAKHDENYMPPEAKDAVAQAKQASKTLVK
jgi:cytochrome c-type biogenesis protein CcmE